MSRRLVVASLVGAAVVGTVVPSFAASNSSPGSTLPVAVHVSTNGGVFVGVTIQGQPAAAASVANGQACAGISLQVPVCVGLPGVQGPPPPPSGTRQSLPVVVYHDDTKTAVGVRDIGVVVYNDGTVCPIVSTQVWRCVSV